MTDPITAAGAFAFLNSAFKLSEYAVKLYGVESENGVFVRTIHRVRLDLEETERLLSTPSVKEKLISIPGKLPWIKGVVVSTKNALNEIGKWVERVRADKEGYGTISFENRVRWVFNDQEKLVNRSMELRTSHQALSTVLAYLTPLEQTATLLVTGPPAYEDATFFDDLLSPRQKRKKAQYAGKGHKEEKRGDEGISNQQTEEPRSACPTTQSTERDEIQGGEDFRASGKLSSFQTSGPSMSSSWSPTSQRDSIVSLAPSSTGSDFLTIPTPTTSFSEPSAEEWSSNYYEPFPFITPSSGSVLSTSVEPLSPNILMSSEPFAITSSISSPLPPASSSGYSSQVELPVWPTSPLSWTILPSNNSASMLQEADGTTLHQTSDAPSSSIYSQAASLTYSPPQFYPPVSPLARPSDITSPSTPIIDDQAILSHQPNSTARSPLPKHNTTQPTQHQFSPNSPGPVDPYELWAKPESLPNLVRDQALGSKLFSHPGAVELFPPIDCPVFSQNPPPLPATSRTSAGHDNIAEMMGDLSVRHPKTHHSAANLSNDFLATGSQSNDSFKELLPRVPSLNVISTSRSKMPGNTTVGHATRASFATELSAEPYSDRKRSQNPPPESGNYKISPSYAEMLELDVSQVPQPRYQYPLSPESPSSHQPQTQSQSQSCQQNQYQYQPYRPPLPPPSHLDPIGTATPFPISSVQQQHQTRSTPVAPPVQPATAAQTVTLSTEQDHLLSRPPTAGEARRRNQKALLALMSKERYD